MNSVMKGKRLRDMRRSNVADYNAKGFSQAVIARTLQVSEATVSRDMVYLQEQAKKNIVNYAENLMPLIFSETVNGVTAILREAWSISSQREIDNKEKVLALSLAKDCYSMRFDLLTHAETIGTAMKFISKHKQGKDLKQNDQEQDQKNNNDVANNKNDTSSNISSSGEGDSELVEEEEESEEENNNTNDDIEIQTTEELF